MLIMFQFRINRFLLRIIGEDGKQRCFQPNTKYSIYMYCIFELIITNLVELRKNTWHSYQGFFAWALVDFCEKWMIQYPHLATPPQGCWRSRTGCAVPHQDWVDFTWWGPLRHNHCVNIKWKLTKYLVMKWYLALIKAIARFHDEYRQLICDLLY